MTWLWLVACGAALLATAGMFVRANDQWGRLDRAHRVLTAGLVSVFVVVTYGTGEAYVQHAAVGARVPAWIVACSVVLIGLWLVHRVPRR